MIVAGMIRVKNGARWIGECLSQLHAVCDHIYILDDHSTDDTVRTCGHSAASYPGHVTVFPSPFEGLDETRDKNWLLREILWNSPKHCYGHMPDWVVAMDADEALIYPDHLLDAICSGKADAYSLHFLFLHDNPNQVRVDGVYRDYCRPSVWRLAASNGVFLGSGAAGGLHCGS